MSSYLQTARKKHRGERRFLRLSAPLHTLAFVRDESAILTNNKGALVGSSTNSGLA